MYMMVPRLSITDEYNSYVANVKQMLVAQIYKFVTPPVEFIYQSPYIGWYWSGSLTIEFERRKCLILVKQTNDSFCCWYRYNK